MAPRTPSPPKVQNQSTGKRKADSPVSPAAEEADVNPLPECPPKRRMLQLQASQQNLHREIQINTKSLTPAASFDGDYWDSVDKILAQRQLLLQHNDEIALLEYVQNGGNEAAWPTQPLGREFALQKCHLREQSDRCKSQAMRMREGTRHNTQIGKSVVAGILRRAGVEVSMGRRCGKAKKQFRQQVFERYHRIGPVPESELMNRGLPAKGWDVINAKCNNMSNFCASHFFPHGLGPDAMGAIFGEGAAADLNDPANGLLLPTYIEAWLEKGYFSVYPDFPDDADLETRLAWNRSDPKEYRLRFFEKSDDPNHFYNSDANETFKWRDLDGRRLTFQPGNNARPRARYIYFQYLLNWQRYIWGLRSRAENQAVIYEKLDEELEQPYWGTMGRYVAKEQLRYFVRQAGHRTMQPDGNLAPIAPSVTSSRSRSSTLQDIFSPPETPLPRGSNTHETTPGEITPDETTELRSCLLKRFNNLLGPELAPATSESSDDSDD